MTNQENKLAYKDLELPNYVNTRNVFANLDVTDLVKAAVLAPLNILLVGDTGTGKTQLAIDIYNSYFYGNKKEGGHGVFIRAHPEIDIYNEIFTELNIGRASRELTNSIEAMVYAVDELNRSPVVAQNQFFGLGDGKMDYKGNSIQLGKNGYIILIATANIGNGEFQGTFETDKALYNRLHVVIDFDYNMFKPDRYDEFFTDKRGADPNVKGATPRDITNKIINASKEIAEITKEPGLEALAVVNYLRFGLDNCQRNGSKDKIWPLNCQDCEHNGEGNLCSLIKAPVKRTINATIKYAAALEYLSKLKDSKQEINPVDLMFKAFEFTGAYQLLLNPQVLRQEYYEQNPKMMIALMEKLKDDFRTNEDYMLASIEAARKGKKVTRFFNKDGRIGNWDRLEPELRKEMVKIEPYNDKREIGLGWMEDFIDFQLENK